MQDKLEPVLEPGTQYLDPAALVFTREGDDGRVKLELKGPEPCSFAHIRALPAFPFSAPGEMIQLYEVKDDGLTGKMIGVLEHLGALSRGNVEIIERLIRRTRLLPVITRIEKLRDEWHAFHWHVQTDRGPHDFFTGRPRESIQFASGTRLVVEDLAGNNYVIADWKALDARSRAFLEQVT